MALALTRGAALPNFTFVMTSASSHAPTSGLTVSGKISKDGGAFAALTNTPTEIGFGFYKVTITSGETDAVVLALRMTASGADDLGIVLLTQS